MRGFFTILGICNMLVPTPCATRPPQRFSLKLITAKPTICAQQPATAAPPARPVKPKAAQIAAAEADIDRKIKEAEERARLANYVGGALGWPCDLKHNVISSYFVSRINPIYGYYENHNGIDIPLPYGSPVLAANAGTVIVSEYHYSYGYYVVIDHGGGISTLYGHNSKLLVAVGDQVTKGQQIAKAGSTGYSTGNHIHFCVRENGIHVDPLGYVNQP